jgi:hypothetical protein
VLLRLTRIPRRIFDIYIVANGLLSLSHVGLLLLFVETFFHILRIQIAPRFFRIDPDS